MNKIFVRHVTKNDYEFILKVRNQESVRTACHDTNLILPEQHNSYMNKIMNQPQWIISFDGKDVGHCKIIDNEFGYMILDEYARKGIMTKAHKLIFEECKTLGIKLLKDTIKIENTASLHIAEKLGFKRTGVIKKDKMPYAYTLQKEIQ